MSKQHRAIDFIYHGWKTGRLAPLIIYPRYMWFTAISRMPTIFYDKTFNSSYQPWVTRNNVLLILSSVLIFKYNISQRRREGLDQKSCCCCCICPFTKNSCPLGGCKSS